jgi:hypothetical protein
MALGGKGRDDHWSSSGRAWTAGGALLGQAEEVRPDQIRRESEHAVR